MADIIQLRHDTEANWTSANPILALSEFGITTDTTPIKIKIGNGTSNWATLPYVTAEIPNATSSIAGGIKLAGDFDPSSTGDSPQLKASGVTASTYAGHLSVTVNAKGLVTSMRTLTIAEQNIPCGFSLEVVPSFGLASGKVVLPFAMKITQVDICSTTAAGADLTPSISTNMLVYQNGSSILTQAFSAANTTNAAVTLDLAAGDKIYISQSAINGTAQVTMSFKGVRA